MPKPPLLLAILGATCLSAAAQPVIWNEFVQGDFSDDRFNPTPLVLPAGISQLVGSMDGDVGGIVDRDYFSIVVPQGFVLAQMILEQYFSDDPVAFISIQPGPIFPNDPMTVNPGDLLGWMHFGADNVGMDLLPILGSQGQGFTPPLPAGTYTFWAQQTGEPTSYVLDFVVIVPAPGGLVLLAVPLLLRRRRTR